VSTVLWQPCLGTTVSVGQTHCFALPRAQLLSLFRSFPDFERDLLDFAMSQLISHTQALKDVKKDVKKPVIATEHKPVPNIIRRVSVNLQAALAFQSATGAVHLTMCGSYISALMCLQQSLLPLFLQHNPVSRHRLSNLQH
jgi:hypothetical protein